MLMLRPGGPGRQTDTEAGDWVTGIGDWSFACDCRRKGASPILDPSLRSTEHRIGSRLTGHTVLSWTRPDSLQ